MTPGSKAFLIPWVSVSGVYVDPRGPIRTVFSSVAVEGNQRQLSYLLLSLEIERYTEVQYSIVTTQRQRDRACRCRCTYILHFCDRGRCTTYILYFFNQTHTCAMALTEEQQQQIVTHKREAARKRAASARRRAAFKQPGHSSNSSSLLASAMTE